MTFGLGCTKKLTSLLHWIQDCFCTNDDSDHTLFNNQVLAEVQSYAHIRKPNMNLVNTDTNAKAKDPGKFKDEYLWHEWE